MFFNVRVVYNYNLQFEFMVEAESSTMSVERGLEVAKDLFKQNHPEGDFHLKFIETEKSKYQTVVRENALVLQ